MPLTEAGPQFAYPEPVSRTSARRWLFCAAGTFILLAAIAYVLHESSVAYIRSAQLLTGRKLREIINGPEGYYASAFRGVLYVGSDDQCDYFAISHGDLGVRVLKARRGEVDLKHRMKITSDEKSWLDVTNQFPPPR